MSITGNERFLNPMHPKALLCVCVCLNNTALRMCEKNTQQNCIIWHCKQIQLLRKKMHIKCHFLMKTKHVPSRVANEIVTFQSIVHTRPSLFHVLYICIWLAQCSCIIRLKPPYTQMYTTKCHFSIFIGFLINLANSMQSNRERNTHTHTKHKRPDFLLCLYGINYCQNQTG